MEHCDGGDVAALLKQCRKQKCFLPEQKVWDIFVQTVIAMQACHRRKAGAVMHRVRVVRARARVRVRVRVR